MHKSALCLRLSWWVSIVGFFYTSLLTSLFFHIQITPAFVLRGALLCTFCLELYIKRDTKRDPKRDPQKSLFFRSVYDSLCKSLFHTWHGTHLYLSCMAFTCARCASSCFVHSSSTSLRVLCSAKYVKWDQSLREKRPIHMRNETNNTKPVYNPVTPPRHLWECCGTPNMSNKTELYVNRDLHIFEKRPTTQNPSAIQYTPPQRLR